MDTQERRGAAQRQYPRGAGLVLDTWLLGRLLSGRVHPNRFVCADAPRKSAKDSRIVPSRRSAFRIGQELLWLSEI